MAVPLQVQMKMEPGIVEYKLPFKGGEVKVALNTLKGDVVRQLLIMSYLVKEGDSYQEIDLPLVNSKQFHLKLNLDSPESRMRLKNIAESYKEIYHNKFVITRMNYLGGNILAVFNTAKEDVITGLQKLNDEVDDKLYFVEQTFGLFNETNLKVKLNLNEKHVRDALKKLAVKYSDTPAVIEPNPVTVNLPFKRGTAVGIIDLNKLEVINTLRKLNHDVNEAQPFVVQTFELWNGEKLSVKLNMDNIKVRNALKQIADNYHELHGKAEANLYRITFADGKVKGTFDLSKDKVIKALMDLDRNVDVNKPYEIKRIPLENGAVIYVRLNINSSETIKKLKETADDYEEELDHIPNTYEVIDLPYLSNIARVVLNVGKDDVLQELKNLNENVEDNLYVVKNIHLPNGTIAKIKLGINDLLTLATLRRLSDAYTIITNNTDYRYESKTLPFGNGNAVAVFDVSDLAVIEKLRNLDNRAVNLSHQATEFRLFNGSVLSVLLNTDDLSTRETLKDIAIRYEECIKPIASNYVTKSLTWSGGNVMAIFDQENPKVVEGLHRISKMYDGNRSATVYNFSSNADSTLLVKLDLENPKVRANLKTLSKEYKEYLKPYVPNFITLYLECEKGIILGVYDVNNPCVILGLRSLNDSNGTEVWVDLDNNIKIPLRLDARKKETREVLRSLAVRYEEIIRPYLPHYVIKIFSSRDKLAVGVFDMNNPKVVRTLQDLNSDEEQGQIYSFSLGNGTCLRVAFNMNNPNTLVHLMDVAEKFVKLNNSNYVIVRLPFTDGLALAAFDFNKPEVIRGMKELNSSDESSNIHLIPLNDVETITLKLNLQNPINREALRKLAETYEEYVYPKFNFATKLLTWKNGRAVIVLDMLKPEVIQGLRNLHTEMGKVEVFPLSNGKNLTVSLNLNNEDVRETLRMLSEIYEEYIVPTYVPQTLEFDGYLASAVYDVSKPEVVKGLQENFSSSVIDGSIVKKNFTLIDGELLEVKYNPSDSKVRGSLQSLADHYQEVQVPNYVGASIDFGVGRAGVILNLNKPEVLSSLKKLDQEVNLEEPVVSVDIPINRDKFWTVKLNMKNPETRDALRGIAEHYNEIIYKSNMVSFELPFDEGLITFTVDSFKNDVVEELRRMTKEAREDSPGGEIPLASENLIPFKINTNDLRNRQRLENIAVKYKEVLIDQPPKYEIKILPYSSGKLVAVLDINKKEVQETLQMLNDLVDESKPYIKERIHLSNNTVLNIKLNIEDSSVRVIICDIAHDCDDVPFNVGPKFVSHNMPYDGGIAVAIFDVNKIEVIEGLISLQDKVADGQSNITRDFPLDDGSVLQVKLDINDLETRHALQKIAENYEEVPEPRRSRTVVLELPFNDGLIVTTFDVSNDEVIEKLKALTSPYDQGSSLLVEIPLANGTLLNLNVNVNDPQVRNVMRNLAIQYQEIFDPLQPRHMIFKTPFKDGEIIFVIDVWKTAAMKKLEELGKHLSDKDSHVTLRLPLENGTVVDLKIDPNDPNTREVLAETAVEYNEVLNSTNPHLSQHQLRCDKGWIFVTFDTSDPKVIQKLKDLNNQVRKNEPHITLKILQADGSVEHIKLNIDDSKVRSELKSISNTYRQISRTGFPNHFENSHYKLPFSEGNILMTLKSDDPTVLQVLGKLNDEATKRDSPFTIRLPLPNGSLKQFKLDLSNSTTRQSLLNISESYREVVAEQQLTKIVNYEFPLEENKKLRVSLDLANKEVINTLLELNDEIDGEIIDQYSDAVSDTKIKLDVKDSYTQKELKRVANKYELVNDMDNKPMDEAVILTFHLPFKDGHVMAALDPYDPEVLSELLELNSKVNTSQRRVNLRLPIDDNENINIRLNIDNPEIRSVLKRIAIKYSEVTDQVRNNFVLHQLPFNHGILEIVLDLSDPEVIETLLTLSKQVGETDKYATIQIPSVDGADKNIKLYMDDPEVRNVLQNIALEYKISWHSQKQFLEPSLHLFKFQLPFEGGKFAFTVNVQNKTVVEGLRELSRKVDVTKPRIVTKVNLTDGSFLNIRLNPNNSKTREALKKIVSDYEEIPNTETSEDAGTPEIVFDGEKPREDDVRESVPLNTVQVITGSLRKEEPSITNNSQETSTKEEPSISNPETREALKKIKGSLRKEEPSITNKSQETSIKEEPSISNPKTREVLKKINLDDKEIPNTEASEHVGTPGIAVDGEKSLKDDVSESVPLGIVQGITENSRKEEPINNNLQTRETLKKIEEIPNTEASEDAGKPEIAVNGEKSTKDNVSESLPVHIVEVITKNSTKEEPIIHDPQIRETLKKVISDHEEISNTEATEDKGTPGIAVDGEKSTKDNVSESVPLNIVEVITKNSTKEEPIINDPQIRETLKKVISDHEEIPNTEASEDAGRPEITVDGEKSTKDNVSESVPLHTVEVITKNSRKEEPIVNEPQIKEALKKIISDNEEISNAEATEDAGTPEIAVDGEKLTKGDVSENVPLNIDQVNTENLRKEGLNTADVTEKSNQTKSNQEELNREKLLGAKGNSQPSETNLRANEVNKPKPTKKESQPNEISLLVKVNETKPGNEESYEDETHEKDRPVEQPSFPLDISSGIDLQFNANADFLDRL